MRNDFEQIPVSEKLNGRVNKTLDIIRKKKRRKAVRNTVTGIGSAAAVFAAVLILGETNPVLAGKIPFIGHFFEQVETDVLYKGEYSKDAVQLITEETGGGAETGTAQETDPEAAAEADSPYIQTSDGITVTVSEITCTKKAVYLAMSIENEEEFPADFIRTQNMEDYALDYDRLELESDGSISGIDNGNILLHYLEGQFEDSHTFVGIARIDLTSFTTAYPTEEEIEAAGLKELEESIWEEGISDDEGYARADEFNLKLKEAFPEAGMAVEAPDEFTLTLNISKIWADLQTGTMVPRTFPDGEEIEVFEADRKEYKGTWSFSFDVKLDEDKIETVTVNDTNDDGAGIATVERTPYEVTATPIIPDDKMSYDYFLVICDADGDLLDYQGSSSDIYQTYGRNTDTVYVYLCDYIEYMDELKGYYWSLDYEEKKKTKTFAQYLDEKAVYGTKVTFDGEAE